jgi:transcriptional regulator PpsR
MDMDAVITDVKLSNAIAGEKFFDWVGRAWADTVADFAGDKVRAMVSDARESGVSAFRQVTQRFPSGLEVSIEYTTVRIGADGGLIAVGKSLQAVSELQARLIAAQHAMEQDYWKLREVETRYRLLFDASNDAVLLLHMDNLSVVEANPAALRSLGVARGWNFLSEIAPQEHNPFKAMLARAREAGKAPAIVIHLGPDREPWIVRATVTNAESISVFMLQLSSVGVASAAAGRAEPPGLATLVERMPDGFAVLDRDGVIQRANRAFLDLVQLGVEGAAVGKSLERWLTYPGADLAALLSTIRTHGVFSMFSATMRGELGTNIEVEISGASDSANAPALIGVWVHDVSRRGVSPKADFLRQAMDAARTRNANAPLRQVLEDVTALIERDYVVSALQQTNGNRAAAAELLGMSRQSLYAKLNRYGLDGDTKKRA